MELLLPWVLAVRSRCLLTQLHDRSYRPNSKANKHLRLRLYCCALLNAALSCLHDNGVVQKVEVTAVGSSNHTLTSYPALQHLLAIPTVQKPRLPLPATQARNAAQRLLQHALDRFDLVKFQQNPQGCVMKARC